jgi:hypothetical protein
MPRNEARVFTSIWDDEDDFVDLSFEAKGVYFFLFTQPGLEHSGVITITMRKWSRKLGLDEDRLHAALVELDEARYIGLDEHTEEALVRALIRRDGVWKQPKILRGALKHAAQVESVRLRAMIVAELARLDPSTLPQQTRGEITGLLANLPPRLASATPQGPGGGGGQPPHEAPADAPGQPPHEGPVEAPGHAHPHAPGEGVGGGGNGNGSNHRVSPSPRSLPLSPGPTGAPPASVTPLWPVAVPAPPPEGEEGDISDGPTPAGLTDFVAEVRTVRPEWSTASIHRALTHPSVVERGWHRAQGAMLAIAHDPASQAPGRLSHDGPWWHRAPPAAAAPQSRPTPGVARCTHGQPLARDGTGCAECPPAKTRTAS